MRSARFLAFAAAYAAAIALGRLTVSDGGTLALFWPASGVGVLWAMTARGRSELRASALAVAGLSAAGNYLGGTSLDSALVLGVANVTISHLGARVVVGPDDTVGGPRWQLVRLGRFYRLLLGAAVAAVVSAVPGMVALAVGGDTPTAGDAMVWVLRHAAAVVVVAGTGLALLTPERRRRPSTLEVGALFALTVVLEWAVFAPDHRLPLEFLPFALLFWSGVRMPVRLAAVHSALVGTMTLVLVRGFGGGPFGAIADTASRAVTVQVFMLLATSLCLVLAVAWDEREGLAADLAASERTSRERAEDLSAVTQTIPDGLLVISRSGEVLLHNEAAQAFLDASERAPGDTGPFHVEMSAKRRLDGGLLPDDERPSVRALAGEQVRGVVVRGGPSDSRVYSVSASPLHDSLSAGGEAQRAVLLLRDVTVEHSRVVELEVARRRAERLFADAPTGVVVLDLDGRVRQANAAAVAMLGSEPTLVVGRPLAAVATEPDLVTEHLARTVRLPGSRTSLDWTVTGPGGTGTHVSMTTRVLQGGEDAEDVVLAHLVDVTERRSYEERLVHLADHDPLTGLPNRRLFERHLHAHVARCAAEEQRGALLLLDLDNFKEVNDTLGHRAGDDLLVSVAGVLRESLRGADLVARLGGDEFAVLLPDADRAEGEEVARRIVTALREHTATLTGANRRVTASVGATTFAAAAQHGADPLAMADMLLYDAKDAGRDRFMVLDTGREQPRTGVRLAWRARLETALEAGDFELYLQPIMDLRTGAIGSAEALLRLTDTAEGPVSPGSFMDIAESTGLAPALDSWVLRRAARLLADLRRQHPGFQLEVNLSAHSIGDPEVERTLTEALLRHAVDPSALVLEITETAAVADLGTARRFAERVTSLGARFALDDFGAGYGSFYYLKHLPFDFIKIDGEFVAHADRSAADRTILRSIAGIARDLGKQTIAEFVVNEAVLDVVRREGIDYAQGYAVGPPVTVAEFTERWPYLAPERA